LAVESCVCIELRHIRSGCRAPQDTQDIGHREE
jgi:hypothetical protein